MPMAKIATTGMAMSRPILRPRSSVVTSTTGVGVAVTITTMGVIVGVAVGGAGVDVLVGSGVGVFVGVGVGECVGVAVGVSVGGTGVGVLVGNGVAVLVGSGVGVLVGVGVAVGGTAVGDGVGVGVQVGIGTWGGITSTNRVVLLCSFPSSTCEAASTTTVFSPGPTPGDLQSDGIAHSKAFRGHARETVRSQSRTGRPSASPSVTNDHFVGYWHDLRFIETYSADRTQSHLILHASKHKVRQGFRGRSWAGQWRWRRSRDRRRCRCRSPGSMSRSGSTSQSGPGCQSGPGSGYRSGPSVGVGSSTTGAAITRTPVIVAVGEIEVPIRVERHAQGTVHRGGKGRSTVSCEGDDAVPGNGGHRTVGLDCPDAMVESIGDENVAVGVHGHPSRLDQAGLNGRAVVLRRRPRCHCRAMVEITFVSPSTRRILRFPVSAMMRLPSESTARPSGLFSLARVA